jgi:cellobiose phosphorylase
VEVGGSIGIPAEASAQTPSATASCVLCKGPARGNPIKEESTGKFASGGFGACAGPTPDTPGREGKGESVWLGFFLYEVLMRFTEVARKRGDASFADRCRSEAAQVHRNIEQNGWDGAWYRRAYFDDGSPLGSASNPECQIDSVAQSWSVLSGGGDPGRSCMAMEAVDKRLVRRDHALIQLLDPPFDKSNLNPGYIKGYVPGIWLLERRVEHEEL